jgi:hypothetical protein
VVSGWHADDGLAGAKVTSFTTSIAAARGPLRSREWHAGCNWMQLDATDIQEAPRLQQTVAPHDRTCHAKHTTWKDKTNKTSNIETSLVSLIST